MSRVSSVPILMFVIAVMAGCASPGKYRNMPTEKLCYEYETNFFVNVNQGERRRELERRGADCSQYDNSYKFGNSPQDAALMMQLMQQQPQVYQQQRIRPAPPVNTNCIQSGGVVNCTTN